MLDGNATAPAPPSGDGGRPPPGGWQLACQIPIGLVHFLVHDGALTESSTFDDSRKARMALQLGDEAPDFTADIAAGTIHFHEWLGDGWGVVFSHPKDFTPVGTTELGTTPRLSPSVSTRLCRIRGGSLHQ
jgi:AhpC/TSA family